MIRKLAPWMAATLLLPSIAFAEEKPLSKVRMRSGNYSGVSPVITASKLGLRGVTTP